MRRALAAACCVALLALGSGCAEDDGGEVPGPGAAQIDVDTPELRQAKRAALVEDCRPGDGEPVDGGLPDVTLPCFGGGPDVDLASLRGPLVVSLWASWCGPCRQEMPVLEEFHQAYGDRVPVLGIDYSDPQTGAAMALVEETGATYPLLADPQEDLSAADPFPPLQGLPFLALVDEEGRVAWSGFTVVESSEQLEGLVREHLGVAL